MNENQLKKFKGHLLNICTQIENASLKLSNEPIEQQTNHRLRLALQQIKMSYELAQEIKAIEPPQIKPKKKQKYYPMPEVVVIQKESAPRTYNLRCRNYGEIIDKDGKVIERTCVIGMDLDFCSKNCAYATNNVCTLKG